MFANVCIIELDCDPVGSGSHAGQPTLFIGGVGGGNLYITHKDYVEIPKTTLSAKDPQSLVEGIWERASITQQDCPQYGCEHVYVVIWGNHVHQGDDESVHLDVSIWAEAIGCPLRRIFKQVDTIVVLDDGGLFTGINVVSEEQDGGGC